MPASLCFQTARVVMLTPTTSDAHQQGHDTRVLLNQAPA
jgi:hypothetical protein